MNQEPNCKCNLGGLKTSKRGEREDPCWKVKHFTYKYKQWQQTAGNYPFTKWGLVSSTTPPLS